MTIVGKDYSVCMVHEELSEGIEWSLEINNHYGQVINIPSDQLDSFIADVEKEARMFKMFKSTILAKHARDTK